MEEIALQTSNNLCQDCKIFAVTNLIITCSCQEKPQFSNQVSPLIENLLQQLSLDQLDSETNFLGLQMQLESKNIQRHLIESEETKSSVQNTKNTLLTKNLLIKPQPKKNVNWGPRPKGAKRYDKNFNKKYAKRIQYALRNQRKWYKTKISGYMVHKNSPFCHYLIADLYRSRQKLQQFKQILLKMEKQFIAEIIEWGQKYNSMQQSLIEIELLKVQLINLHYYIQYDILPSVTPNGLQVITLNRDQLYKNIVKN